MNKRIGLRWAVIMAGAMLLVLAAACGGEKEIVEVVKEVVVEKVVVKEMPVKVEKVVEVEKEVVKEVKVEVPVEVVKEVEVIKEVPKVITEEKVVVREGDKVVVATAVPVGEQRFFMRTLDPNPKYGGVAILGSHGPPSIFDLISSQTIANHGISGQMWENLLRLDPRVPLTPIVPDLAWRWEISPDFKKYSFDLREGVMWSDGIEFTSADVKATYERIRFPRADQVSIRGALYSAVEEINAPNKYRVEFVMSKPVTAGTIMPAFAMSWTEILSKKVLDENNGDLHDLDSHASTGPYRHVSRDDEGWTLEANPDYWNPYVPYLDGIKHVWLFAWSPQLSAAMLGGIVDFGRLLAAKDGNDILDDKYPGLSGLREVLPIGSFVPFNLDKPYLQDTRVRRALFLVIDNWALRDAISDLRGTGPGGWFVTGTPYAKSDSVLLSTPGLRPPTDEDIAEARQLMADAGYPNGEGFPKLWMPVRETNDQRTQAPLIQAMLKDGLNIDVEITIEDASAIGQLQFERKWDLLTNADWAVGVPDPAVYMRPGFGVCGGKPCDQNYSGWNNPEFNALVDQLEVELDEDKRRAITDKMWDVLNSDPPSEPKFTAEYIFQGYWSQLKGHFPHKTTLAPNRLDLNKWDTQWLDRK